MVIESRYEEMEFVISKGCRDFDIFYPEITKSYPVMTRSYLFMTVDVKICWMPSINHRSLSVLACILHSTNIESADLICRLLFQKKWLFIARHQGPTLL